MLSNTTYKTLVNLTFPLLVVYVQLPHVYLYRTSIITNVQLHYVCISSLRLLIFLCFLENKILQICKLWIYADDYHYPFPKQLILDSSKLKEFADNNFRFDDKGRNFSTPVENTVEKGEIAHYKQFLLFPLCFQKTCTAKHMKPGLVWERINPFPHNDTF